MDTVDVVVVGAGAGGLATAVTAAHHGLRVVVLERADVCGGATAWSGGWMWAPGNPLARADGVSEDVEQFRTYLRAALGEDYDAARVDAFLAAAPEMVGFFHEHTALKFVPGASICDIYGDLPGAGTGHRSVAPAPSTGARSGPRCWGSCAASSTRRRSSAWGSWPGRTSRRSSRRPAATPAACCTPPGGSRATCSTSSPAAAACSWSTAPR